MKRASFVFRSAQSARRSSISALSTAAGAVLLLAAGCATWQPPVDTSTESLQARAMTAGERDVRVSAAVLSAEDSRRMFGADLTGKGMQPVWIEVQNGSQRPLWLLRSGIDPDYFSPLEVAWSLHAKFAGKTNAEIDQHFKAQEFVNPIAPGATRSGIVFTNPQLRTRVLNVDLLGDKQLYPFSLFLPVPDRGGDERVAPPSNRYTDAQVTDYQDAASLRAALEQLPCCASDDNGTSGDPLNLLIVGDMSDIAAAVTRRGFRIDAWDFDETQRVFGRSPDVVLRKHAQGGAPATWVRAWLAPLRFQGRSIVIAQVGRPRGGRFIAEDEANPTLHPDVDEARNVLIQDMMYSGGLAKLGFVDGVGAAPAAAPRGALRGTSYYTDGLRAVLFLITRPLGLADLEILNWTPYRERPEDKQASTRDAERE